jgi:hypothetical protein
MKNKTIFQTIHDSEHIQNALLNWFRVNHNMDIEIDMYPNFLHISNKEDGISFCWIRENAVQCEDFEDGTVIDLYGDFKQVIVGIIRKEKIRVFMESEA